MATVHVVLLRGINVGTRNRIAMADLRAMLGERGYTGVRTLLNSGNVVLTAESAEPAVVAAEVRAGIEETFGLAIHVVVRSLEQVRAVIEANPMPDQARLEPKFLHVGFCDPAPPDGAVRELAARAGPDERIEEVGGTVYAWFAHGVQSSRLAAAISASPIGPTITLRNWNTLHKLPT